MNKFLQIAAAATAVALPLYVADMRRAYKRLEQYETDSFKTASGTMAYVDEGFGETILISHGIFGGYDQGMVSLKGIVGDDYRKIALSRFGYPGSELPPMPTPQHQASVFAELLDHLNIEKAFILATSAGGAAALSFGLRYPERAKGLILVSSGVPSAKIAAEQAKSAGPPHALLYEFPIWLSTKFLGPILGLTFGSKVDKEFLQTMLPIKPRRKGIETDAELTNLDMDVHYEKYPIEEIDVPILVIHAKDDPMAKFGSIEKFLTRTHAETVIFDTGGHLLSGHQTEGTAAIKKFITKHS
ncbi:alpha/beta fold hydrolase [Planococcus dechangensis]|uniref:Alpha/beta fold hydrolase n=1 Tax=Planococcus dechangensis TaxID=1176255 RepID=A0ABV9MGU4_9BACL